MIRYNFFIVLILLAAKAFGQDCAQLQENAVIRLDKEGGPLNNSRIQDQDGIGSCFANATSVALQSALPGNPDVSYLHLAFAYAQTEVAPKNNNRDSAFVYSDDGTKGNVLINGGQVCETIEAVKNVKIGGVCRRDDVALEKSLFDQKTNNSKDSLFAQTKIIDAVSEYYDSIKNKFGVNASVPPAEIAKRTLAFNNYKAAFDNLIENNQKKFNQAICLKPDISNSESVFKNILARIYSNFQTKYGSGNSSRAYERIGGKINPDSNLFFYSMTKGTVFSYKSEGDQLTVRVDDKVKKSLESNYLGELTSATPPKDALSAFRNTLKKGEDKKYFPVIDKILAELSAEDKNLLEKDYNRYVKKDIAECLQKKPFEYFKSDDGLVKDFASDGCLQHYLPEGKNLQSLAQILDRNNLGTVDTLNSFLAKLPSMNYEEAMRAIVAPDCNAANKIKIPTNLKCESKNFNYISDLKYKLINDGVVTSSTLEANINAESEREKLALDAAFPALVAAVDAKYAGKTDGASLESKRIELSNLQIELNNKKNRSHDVATAKIAKQLMGAANEQRYWDSYVSSNKSQFNSDAVSLLKNQKQALPITLCTRMFSSPEAVALRDGRCEKDSADSDYTAVGGYHAMTIVGVRCQKGKLNYLIQNSWGDWDSITKAKNADGGQHFEHEFGKAWMNEDEIMNNSYGYQKITR